jgi:low affinity Fe/Cu permease
MKKTIIAIAVLAIFSIDNTFAQKGNPSKGKNVPTAVYQPDKTLDSYNVNTLDDIVGLTRKQENEIKKIEKKYDQIAVTRRKSLSLQDIKKLEEKKQQEILSVLSPIQRKQLVAYEQSHKFDARGRSNRRS